MTNDKKQTAVEWLIEQVEGLNINDDTVWAEVTKQALEMEKQQIIDAVVQDDINYHDNNTEKAILRAVNRVETYYKETYDKNS